MERVLLATLAALLAIQAGWTQTVINGSRQIVGGGLDAGKSAYTRVMTGVGAPASALCNTARTITAATAASPPVVTSTGHGFSSGDVVVVYGAIVGGMAGLAGTFVVGSVTANTFALCGAWDGTNCQSPPTTSGTYTSGAFASNQVGREYFRQDTAAGQNKYYCTDSTGSPTWTQQSGGFNQTIQLNGVSATQRGTVNFVLPNGTLTDTGGTTSTLVIGDPASTMYIKEDFVCGGVLGCNTFTGYSSGSVSSANLQTTSQVSGFPGLVRFTTGATAKTMTSMAVRNATTQAASETFTVRYLIEAFTPGSGVPVVRAGLSGSASTVNPPVNGIYFEHCSGGSSSGCTTNDTDWFLVFMVASTPTRVDTGVAYVNTKTALLLTRVDATHIGYKVATTLAGLTSPTSDVTTEPTVDLVPFIGIANTAAFASTMDFDFVDYLITGLAR